jgi:N utilization substance protein A
VRLASQLTGWTLNVMTSNEAQEKNQGENQAVSDLFMKKLEVDEEVAAALIDEGFSRIEEIAYVPFNEMLEMEIFSEDTIEELQQRAKDALLTQEIASEETLEKTPSEDLLTLEGMDDELATRLAASGIATMEDLAEQAVDDLMDLGILDDQTPPLTLSWQPEHLGLKMKRRIKGVDITWLQSQLNNLRKRLKFHSNAYSHN